MPTSSFESLSAWLCRSGLLTPAQVEELRRQPVSSPDRGGLLKNLVQRGWLTGYQADQIVADKGDELAVGDYRVLGLLGEGATGKVFKARHVPTGRLVAVKVIRQDRVSDARAVQRF